MKKIIALLLVAVLSISLCACGSESTNTIDKNSTDTYVGEWVYNTGKGNIITYHFNKGGIGYYEQSTHENGKWEFTWEVKEGVVITTHTFIGNNFLDSFELNDEDGNLYKISEDEPIGPYIKK